MDIVDSIKSALERFAGIEIFHLLDVSMWNGLPLFSKVCFAAAAVLLVLYIGLVIRGRLFGGDARHAEAQQALRRPDAVEGGSEHPTDGGRLTLVDNPDQWPV
jgi:hypothetical protein